MAVGRKTNGKQRTPKYQDDDYAVDIRGTYQEFLTLKDVKLTPKQQAFVNVIKKNKITICAGPAGSAKTFSALFSAITSLKKKEIEKIVLCKPIITVQDKDKIGFLKGSLEEKLQPYIASFESNMIDMIDEKDVKMLFENKTVEFKPVEYIRGTTLKNSCIIVDEFQNFTLEQLMAIVTRLGKNSTMVFIGDVKQADIAKKNVAVSVFKLILSNIDEIGFFDFDKTDIVREPIIMKIIDNYEKLVEDGTIKE